MACKIRQESLSVSPMWLITYRDCMTLMLVFFLLFMSFASFDDTDKLKKLKTVLNKRFFPLSPAGSDTAAGESAGQIEKNSEQIQASNAGGSPKGEKSGGFRDKKVFIADSAEIFWGDGAIISDNGKKFMAVMSDFLKQMPNDVVICEKSAVFDDKNSSGGSERAWSIIEYLCRDKGMSYDRFKISIAGTTALPESYKQGDRVVEIVLLERSYTN